MLVVSASARCRFVAHWLGSISSSCSPLGAGRACLLDSAVVLLLLLCARVQTCVQAYVQTCV